MILFYLWLVFIVAALKSFARKGPDLHIVLSVILPSFNNTQSLGYGSLLVNVQLTSRYDSLVYYWAIIEHKAI